MELRDLPDPFSKVTSGLISQNKSVRVPLKAVHIRAKVIDMVAKVRQILCENACSMCSIEKFKDWIVHVCHNECIICLIGNHVLIWYSNLILPSFIFFFHPSNLRVIASKSKLFQFIFFKILTRLLSCNLTKTTWQSQSRRSMSSLWMRKLLCVDSKHS